MRDRFFLFGLGVTVLGIFLGQLVADRVLAVSPNMEDKLLLFSEAVHTVQENYMDEINSQQLIHGAIRGMVSQLDPHSNFLDPRTYSKMKEDQKGSFFGLGITVAKRNNNLTVISPIQGTPAFHAGILAGDVIEEIEGTPTREMSIDDAVLRLRGPKGTEVNISIRRDGYEELLDFTIVRDEIPLNSIPYHFMLAPDIGYIRLTNFSETSSDELRDALEDLWQKGMKKLLIDLRSNSGGLLSKAVELTDEFLRNGELIVYTKGRVRGADQNFVAQSDPGHDDYPLIILVNHYSASASEILAGAVQDHDRGLIVGETTWGKGLVQSVYPLSNDCAIALTTARYYTPSGRLIQRDYSNSINDYFNPFPEEDQETNKLTKQTDGGRTVYEKGGITPDVEIEREEVPKLVQKMLDKHFFFDFANYYTTRHPDLSPDFEIDDPLFEEFIDFMREKDGDINLDELDGNAELETFVRNALKGEIISANWGVEESAMLYVQIDNQVQEAAKLFDQAEALLRHYRRN